MSNFAIICEYNPFHNGHKYQIESLKPNTVICLMSSNLVQRGSFAICDKYTRAKAALVSGADLVLELPFPYSMLSAEYFAKSGISILMKLGFINYLSFGAECDNVEKLTKIAKYILSCDCEKKISDIISKNHATSYIRARETAIKDGIGAEYSMIIKQPNNILAIEYIKALIKYKSNIVPMPLLRNGAGYNDMLPNNEFSSAGALRAMIEGGENIKPYLPKEAFEVFENSRKNGTMPSDIYKLENAILAFLRKSKSRDLEGIYDIEPIRERILKGAKKAVSFDELLKICSSKTYTDTRIRRCIMAAFLGITNDMANQEPLYTTLLCANDKGRELLAQKNTDFPIITKPANIKKYAGTNLYRQFESGIIADDIYALSLPNPQMSGESLKRTPHIL